MNDRQVLLLLRGITNPTVSIAIVSCRLRIQYPMKRQ